MYNWRQLLRKKSGSTKVFNRVDFELELIN